MSDYMRGYKSRNKRRRSSYDKRKIYKSYDRPVRPANSYSERGIRATVRRRRRRNALIKRIALASAAVLVVAIVLAFSLKMFSGSPTNSGEEAMVASGSSVNQQANQQPNQQANQQAGTPVPVATQTPDLMTPVPGGVSEVIAMVTLPPDNAIATPVPTPRPKAVALTFDDGPSTETTPKLLDILEKNGAHATFFVVGNRCQSGVSVLKRELQIGCEIGNHTWSHQNLGKMSMHDVNSTCKKTVKKVKKLLNYTIKMVRPPWGSVSTAMRKKLKQPMILWSLDTLDWKTKNTPAIMKEIKKAKDGDIILMHDIHATSVEAVNQVVPWLISHGFDVLTVSELMERKGQAFVDGRAYGNIADAAKQ